MTCEWLWGVYLLQCTDRGIVVLSGLCSIEVTSGPIPLLLIDKLISRPGYTFDRLLEEPRHRRSEKTPWSS